MIMSRLFAAGLLAAAVAGGSASAPAQSNLTITIGPKGVELGVSEQDRARRGRDWRPRCVDRREFDRVLAYQGWRDIHDWNNRRDAVLVKARQWGGLYQLEVDDCSANVLVARRLDFDRDHWDRGGRGGRGGGR